ncbi:hypothetical protein [Winogradskyella bathintestinalis]|uniref:STAS/SEC14 domain-containing protein n=1 Tax=Winogradskyella bathintestinalis TaxID=3035208 RepID=A0ABT7ZYC2_9FLAO|nr:hypothetical protein [Winogradskyella bathintestinalis]MDN3493984.1 hypothetical protein [Winogradskyella bathintestinalis]
MIKHYNLKDAEIYLFDHYIINQIREGVTIEAPHDKELNEIVQEHFSGRDIVYISNRVNSYTVDPLIYKKVEDIPNILAIAIVPKNHLMRRNAEYERQFYDNPFEIFDTINDAIIWANKLTLPENEGANK